MFTQYLAKVDFFYASILTLGELWEVNIEYNVERGGGCGGKVGAQIR
jgi:hypothetical protein